MRKYELTQQDIDLAEDKVIDTFSLVCEDEWLSVTNSEGIELNFTAHPMGVWGEKKSKNTPYRLIRCWFTIKDWYCEDEDIELVIPSTLDINKKYLIEEETTL